MAAPLSTDRTTAAARNHKTHAITISRLRYVCNNVMHRLVQCGCCTRWLRPCSAGRRTWSRCRCCCKDMGRRCAARGCAAQCAAWLCACSVVYRGLHGRHCRADDRLACRTGGCHTRGTVRTQQSLHRCCVLFDPDMAMGFPLCINDAAHSALPPALQPQALTPAQRVARRKDRSGGLLDGIQMIISLVRRW